VESPGSTADAHEPWLKGADELTAALQVEPQRGLTSEQARQRLERFGPNALVPPKEVPAWRKLLAQFEDPLVYLLLAAVLVSLAAWVFEGAHGAPLEALVILAIVILNAALGYAEEAKAEQAVAALQRLAATMAGVLRDGESLRIPAEEVVPGDILVLTEGDAVAADARLLSASNLRLAEASLTGESQPVLKQSSNLEGAVALGDRTNMVYKGTAVTQGVGRALVTATGMSSEMGRIAGLLEQTAQDPSPLEREIERVGKTLGLGVIGIAIVVVGSVLLTARPDSATGVVQVLLLGVSLAVAAVPEGLPAVLSVVLAVGVQRMAKKRAIVKKLSSVETLGSTTVICSDKTGTLTRNEMTIQIVVTHSGEVELTGVGYQPDGQLLVENGPLAGGALKDELSVVLVGGSLANDAVLRQGDDGWVAQGDPTEAAFLVAERKAGLTTERVGRFQRVAELPFTSERKLMSTIAVDAQEERRLRIVTKGAPDVLLGRCSAEQVGTVVEPLTDERRSAILAGIDRLSDGALRTLAVAYRILDRGTQPPDVSAPHAYQQLESNLVYAGTVGMIDPPRAEAKAAIAEAQMAGVRTIMITGDHPGTAARIAENLGVVSAGSRAVTGLELEEQDDTELRRTVRKASVFARVAPEHKLRIVDALQAEHEVVAMTGDGVNDAPALKSADIGIAMGITGTEVTKEAAKMILADDNFATIVAALREGRLIFDNIKKFLRYLLSSNLGEVLTVFLGVVGAPLLGLRAVDGSLTVPLLATHILWINLLTDTGPALALGVDRATEDVMHRPPRSPGAGIIDREMQLGVVFVGLVMAAVTLLALDMKLPGGLWEGSASIVEARTFAFTVLVLAQLFNCFNSRSERESAFRSLFTNPLLFAAILISLLLQIAVVSVPFLRQAFDTQPLSLSDWLLCVALASSVLWLDELKKLAVRAWLARRRAA
jgi:magnesium-transporting ATPase (P-type)